MNIFNFCGSGSGGSGGTSVLIQYQKTVDSSHNTQMIAADYPYQVISQVEVLAPNMANPTIDASYGEQTIYTPEKDSSNNLYIGMDSVTVLAPLMKAITLVGNKDSSTVYNIVDKGDVAAGYVGIEQVTIPPVNASVDSNIDPVNIKDGVTILGVTGVYNQDFDYAILYNKLISI